MLEAVPNVSEGRDAGIVGAIGEAFERHATSRSTSTPTQITNRLVYTLVGDEHALVESLLAGIRVAAERIDLREHVGVHPRIGVADVVPLVPLEPSGTSGASGLAAHALARRIGAIELPPACVSLRRRGGRPSAGLSSAAAASRSSRGE